MAEDPVVKKRRRPRRKKSVQSADLSISTDTVGDSKPVNDDVVVPEGVSSGEVVAKKKRRRRKKKSAKKAVDGVSESGQSDQFDDVVQSESNVNSGDVFQDEVIESENITNDEEVLEDEVSDEVTNKAVTEVSAETTNPWDSFSAPSDGAPSDVAAPSGGAPSDVSTQPVAPEIKEPVGWEDTSGLGVIGGTYGAANAAADSSVDWFGAPVSQPQSSESSPEPSPEPSTEPSSAPAEVPSWFSAPTEPAASVVSNDAKFNEQDTPVVESEPISEPVAEPEPWKAPTFEPEVESKTEPLIEPEAESVSEPEPVSEPETVVSTVHDVTSESSVSEVSAVEEKSEFMNLLAEAGIKKKHLFIAGGIFLSIILVIFVLVFSYGSDSDLNKAIDAASETEKTEEVKKESKEPKESKESKEKVVEKSEVDTADVVDANFQISGLINSYIFGLEFTPNRVLQVLDTTPISDEGTLVGIDSSLAAGQSLRFSESTVAQNLDLLLKIENARNLNLYDYLNRTTDRVAALNEHIRDLQVLLTQAEAYKNAIVAQLNTLNAEYSQITAQRSGYEKAFFDSVNRYYGNDAYNNLVLFTESSQLQVKVKANYNALKTLNAMYDTSIKVLKPRIDDIVLNFDALVKGVQVTEVKNSNINAIKF